MHSSSYARRTMCWINHAAGMTCLRAETICNRRMSVLGCWDGSIRRLILPPGPCSTLSGIGKLAKISREASGLDETGFVGQRTGNELCTYHSHYIERLGDAVKVQRIVSTQMYPAVAHTSCTSHVTGYDITERCNGTAVSLFRPGTAGQ